MKNLITKAGVILISLLLTNCAAIVHGNKQLVDISSQPAGAKVYIDNHVYGSTPTSVKLKRIGRFPGESSYKKQYQVKIELEGYYPYEMKINRTVDGWFFGNILIGGLIGIIVDAASGSMFRLTPDQVVATMGRNNTVMQNGDNIYIAVSLEIDSEWEKIGQLAKR